MNITHEDLWPSYAKVSEDFAVLPFCWLTFFTTQTFTNVAEFLKFINMQHFWILHSMALVLVPQTCRSGMLALSCYGNKKHVGGTPSCYGTMSTGTQTVPYCVTTGRLVKRLLWGTEMLQYTKRKDTNAEMKRPWTQLSLQNLKNRAKLYCWNTATN